MRKPGSVRGLEDLGRVRLSRSFYFREFLYSEISNWFGVRNVPDDPELAIQAGRHLCEEILEPLQSRFGRLAIRSAFRSCEVNQVGNEKNLNCASNESNYAAHIWDRRDAAGNMGAMACVAIPAFADFLDQGGDWRAMAWWIHDHLEHGGLWFYPKLGAFNISWYEGGKGRIDSYIPPKGTLTKPGMPNFTVDHSEHYTGIELFKD